MMKINKKNVLVFLGLVALLGCSQKDTQTGETSDSAPVVMPENTQTFGSSGSDMNEAGELKTVNFDFDKATLTKDAMQILKNNAAWLKNNKNVFVQVEGHCDSKGTIEYNLALGERRAITVKNYLLTLGIEKKRLNTISYGEERPLCSEQDESCLAKNRRANFVITSK